ncbi:histidine kinase [Mycobacteroides abscessus]|nr:histidine kinase [Mycobacteroides abscessus]MDM1906714.1 histidine kinase [Mycobacteroides abscessus]MDM1911399.1 histidine kinase [Mycobacteroides abscessus]MDM1921273.1 histidine kinase [Mycobacteroides abscessus]
MILIWAVIGYQTTTHTPVLAVQSTAAVTVFATTRWGDVTARWLGASVIPVVAVLAYRYSGAHSVLLAVALFVVCWLAGLSLRRLAARAADSLASQRAAEAEAARAHREREQAREIARLREDQVRLTQDVHDVVGHSLAVILAQAESVQFLDAADATAMRKATQCIAEQTRCCLQDIRQVLDPVRALDASPGELHGLIASVRDSGHELVLQESGQARRLAPDLATIAYRVLQEMLTNAIRHGTTIAPTIVELHWSADELVIRCTNTLAEPQCARTRRPGQGLAGMRQRMESINGHLDINVSTGAPPATTAIFAVTAAIPVRTNAT